MPNRNKRAAALELRSQEKGPCIAAYLDQGEGVSMLTGANSAPAAKINSIHAAALQQ